MRDTCRRLQDEHLRTCARPDHVVGEHAFGSNHVLGLRVRRSMSERAILTAASCSCSTRACYDPTHPPRFCNRRQDPPRLRELWAILVSARACLSSAGSPRDRPTVKAIVRAARQTRHPGGHRAGPPCSCASLIQSEPWTRWLSTSAHRYGCWTVVAIEHCRERPPLRTQKPFWADASRYPPRLAAARTPRRVAFHAPGCCGLRLISLVFSSPTSAGSGLSGNPTRPWWQAFDA